MRRSLRALGLGVGALALAGCWPMPGANPDRTGHNPFEATLTRDTVGDLAEQWRWTSPVGPVSDPVTSSGGVHVATSCLVSTLDPATGAEQWTGAIVEEPDCGLAGTPHVGEPYVVDRPGGGQDVEASWGQTAVRSPGFLIASWNTRDFEVGSGTPSAPVGAFVVAARDAGRIGATRAGIAPVTTGEIVTLDGRSFTLDASVTSIRDPISSLTLGEDLVHHGGHGVLATAPGPATFGNGVRGYSRLDDRPGCGPVPLPSPLSPIPVECPVWATPTDGTPTRPVLDAVTGTLYSRTDAGTLYAFDAATGAVRWTATGLGAGGAPAVAGDSVWVPTGDGRVLPFYVWGCGAATCGPWLSGHVDTGTGAPVTAVAVGGDVVYATSAGSVHAVSSCTSDACPVLWSGPGAGSPVISGGHLYVTDGDATLLAYGLP